MNVIAKSTNIAPLVRATANSVSNGSRPLVAVKAQRSKVAVPPTVVRAVGQTMAQDLLTGPLRVSSGIAASTHVQKRLAHTDLPFPNFDAYRKPELRDPTSSNRDTRPSRHLYSYMIIAGGSIATAFTAKYVITDLVSTFGPSANVMAVSQVEIKLNKIPEGKSVTFKWRGKPLFIRHRPASEIQREQGVDVASLRDPQADSERVKRPEWLVVIGVCTHLGCVPIANAGEFGGYYCPCHGSHYDASGRIRKGPAPSNLEVPEYDFVEDTLVVG